LAPPTALQLTPSPPLAPKSAYLCGTQMNSTKIL
jgi:hypothetical protein